MTSSRSDDALILSELVAIQYVHVVMIEQEQHRKCIAHLTIYLARKILSLLFIGFVDSAQLLFSTVHMQLSGSFGRRADDLSRRLQEEQAEKLS